MGLSKREFAVLLAQTFRGYLRHHVCARAGAKKAEELEAADLADETKA